MHSASGGIAEHRGNLVEKTKSAGLASSPRHLRPAGQVVRVSETTTQAGNDLDVLAINLIPAPASVANCSA